MPLRAHPVGEDPHHPHPGVEVPEAQGEGGDGARHPLGVHHQGHGGLKEPSHLGGGAHLSPGVLPVKEAHHPLNQGEVRPPRSVAEEGEEARFVQEEAVQVVGLPARGLLQVGGVKVVRPHLEGLHP